MKNEQDNSLNPSCGYFIKDRGFVTYVELAGSAKPHIVYLLFCGRRQAYFF